MHPVDDDKKPPFNAKELRILGCLLEKQLTSAEAYPLTMNSLTLACNQKTSREPLLSLTEGEVGHVARALIEFGWITIQNSSRAQRVEQNLSRKFKLDKKQQAILAVLLLRRPQTLNEIKMRTERMAEFVADEVQQILDAWTSAERPLVLRLAAGVGKREDRYYHLLGQEELSDLQQEQQSSKPDVNPKYSELADLAPSGQSALLERIEALERRVLELESLFK